MQVFVGVDIGSQKRSIHIMQANGNDVKNLEIDSTMGLG